MNLAIFDVDGTLVTLHPQDDICYVDAIRSAVPPQKQFDIPTQWFDYPFSTDSGVLREIFLRNLKRAPSKKEAKRIEGRYNQLLGATLCEESRIIRQVPGADRIFSFLHSTGEWVPAIATGSWKESTLMKLRFVGISCDLPIASANDELDRAAILTTAVRRASDYYNTPGFLRIVYIGDRLWDYDAARRVRAGFIGIRHSSDVLFPSDARLLESFVDLQLFTKTLDEVASA